VRSSVLADGAMQGGPPAASVVVVCSAGCCGSCALMAAGSEAANATIETIENRTNRHSGSATIQPVAVPKSAKMRAESCMASGTKTANRPHAFTTSVTRPKRPGEPVSPNGMSTKVAIPGRVSPKSNGTRSCTSGHSDAWRKANEPAARPSAWWQPIAFQRPLDG
jgi:hypothetical protein